MANSAPVTSGIRRYKGEWTQTQAAHLLRRTMINNYNDDKYYSTLLEKWFGNDPVETAAVLFKDYPLLPFIS